MDNFAVKQGLRDDEVGERDWSQVNGKINAVIPLQDEAGPFAARLGHFGQLDQASVVQGELQLGDLPFPCGVENHCKALFPSVWVDVKPCINALHVGPLHMDKISPQHLTVFLVESDPGSDHLPRRWTVKESVSSIACSYPSTEILSQAPRILGQVFSHRLKHDFWVGHVVASEWKEHPAF